MKVVGKALLTIGFLVSAVVAIILFEGGAELYTTEKVLHLFDIQAGIALPLILGGAALIGRGRKEKTVMIQQ